MMQQARQMHLMQAMQNQAFLQQRMGMMGGGMMGGMGGAVAPMANAH